MCLHELYTEKAPGNADSSSAVIVSIKQSISVQCSSCWGSYDLVVRPATAHVIFQAPSALLPRMKPDMLQMEDSLDGGPPSVGSGDTAAPVAVTGSACVVFQAPSPLLPKMEPDMLQLEDSLDGGPPSVGSGDTAPPVAVTTPVSSKKVSAPVHSSILIYFCFVLLQ